jgi:hypothetical protein
MALPIPNGAYPLHTTVHQLLGLEITDEVFASLCLQRTHHLSDRIEHSLVTLLVALNKGEDQEACAIALLNILESEYPVLGRNPFPAQTHY